MVCVQVLIWFINADEVIGGQLYMFEFLVLPCEIAAITLTVLHCRNLKVNY